MLDPLRVYDYLSRSRARVLDLREKSEGSFQLWLRVSRTRLGRLRAGIGSYPGWLVDCANGGLLRFLPDQRNRELRDVLAWQAVIDDPAGSPAERLAAGRHVENFTRRWIETVIAPARSLGYDAVMCPEREVRLNRSASTRLFVFDPGFLSPPEPVESTIR